MTIQTSAWDEGSAADNFSPMRLTMARERRGLTKEALAALIGVTRRTVTDWERGSVSEPPIELLSKILGFPVGFFLAGDPHVVNLDAVSFRALSSMTARQTGQVLAAAGLACELSAWIDARYETPPIDLPDLTDLEPAHVPTDPDPVASAAAMRKHWRLGARPVKNMLTLVESHGIRVFSLPADHRRIDAFSFWHGDRAFIFLDTERSAERLRFDLAHELAHLCMHKLPRANRDRSLENSANQFASCFLVPASALYAQVIRHLSLRDVMALKRAWGVSAVAMVRRLYDLQCISDWHYRTWMVELSERGYRTTEPDGMRRESSVLLRKILNVVREDGYSLTRLAEELRITRADLEAAFVGLTLAPIDGGKEGGSVQPPQLRRVL